jgi:hypothetical protein
MPQTQTNLATWQKARDQTLGNQKAQVTKGLEARGALATHEKVSPTFCYCPVLGDKQLWEGILKKLVKVEIVKSLLNGDNDCVHVFHLPTDVL